MCKKCVRNMPVKVKKLGSGKYIVVEKSTGKKSRSSGTFSSRKAAGKQARAINANLSKQGKI